MNCFKNLLFGIIILLVLASITSGQSYSEHALIRQKVCSLPEIWEWNQTVTNQYNGVDLFSYPKTGEVQHEKTESNSPFRWKLIECNGIFEFLTTYISKDDKSASNEEVQK